MPAVADLAALLAVERRLGGDDGDALRERPDGLDLGAVGDERDDLRGARRRLVAEELRRADAVGDLLEHRLDGDLARAVELAARALLGHGLLEPGLVDGGAALLGDDARQVEREAEGVVQLEGELAGDLLAAVFDICSSRIAHAAIERLAEAELLLAADLLDEARALARAPE